MRSPTWAAVLAVFVAGTPAVAGSNDSLVEQARDSMRRSSAYFHDRVATHGGYLWRYSTDFTQREGEKIATKTQIWVQPPGTPTVGLAFLSAFEATREPAYLEYARDAAHALVQGQLRSGGWRYHVEFDPAKRKDYNYRVEPKPARMNSLSDLSTLDDDNTTGALKLLMMVDEAEQFKDASIHDAALYGLDALVAAQYPNGGWAQRYTGPTPQDTKKFPVKKASFPKEWSRTWPFPNNSGEGTFDSYYTLNDMVMSSCIDTLLDAGRIYKSQKYIDSAKKGGDFLILAQMPEPQPAWAQQYDHEMHPAWARQLEPPAIVSYESQFVLQVLLRLYQRTGEKKYLAPIPKALKYLQSSALPDGQLSRFYELETNKPLYVTPDFKLTNEDSNLLPRYGFKMKNQVVAIERAYTRALGAKVGYQPAPPMRLTPEFDAQIRSIIASLDDQGRWLIDARMQVPKGVKPTTAKVLDSKTFADNLVKLSRYVSAVKR